MQLPQKLWEKTPLKQFAEASLEKPGMYLIALRAHLNRGKTMIGDVIDSVAEALPHSAKAAGSDHSGGPISI
jgi:hypothetical protein